jgi:hypothetical protein
MTIELADAIFWAGAGQWCVLIASAMVPVRLDWKNLLAPLPVIVRQLFWIYGGYVVFSIVALGLICLTCSEELAAGTKLARAFCIYGAAFWGIRLSLQPFLAAKPFLTTWGLRAGYYLLPVMFAAFVVIYAWAAVH